MNGPASKPSLYSSPIVLVGGGFLALCVLMIGIVGIASVVERITLRGDVAHFAQTEGTVVVARVVKKSGAGYEPEITFTYVVDGRKLTGTNRRTVTAISQSAAKAEVARIGAQRTLPVFYDPKRPERVVVDKEVSLATSAFVGSIGLLLGAAFIVVRVVIALFRRRRAPG